MSEGTITPGTPWEQAEVPASEMGGATPGPPPAPSFPPYPPYAVEPVPPSVADTIVAGRGLRLQHKSAPKKSVHPPPRPAKPRGPKATDVKLNNRAMRAHTRCLRRHGAVLSDRLEHMSKPLRRRIIYLWRENADTLPPDTIARLRAMLDADEPFKPDQAYEYFINMRKTKKKSNDMRVNQIKKDVLAMCADKRFVWARNASVAFARGIQQRLSRPGQYALADGMLRLSNIILNEVCGYMHMRTPSRRSTNPKSRFMMEVSDKVAVWIDEILSESDDRMLMMDFDEDDEVEKSIADTNRPPAEPDTSMTDATSATLGATPAGTPTATPGETPATTPGATPAVTPASTPGTTPASTPGATPASSAPPSAAPSPAITPKSSKSDVLGADEIRDSEFAGSFLNMMSGGALLKGPQNAYLRFTGEMLEAFNILTESMYGKGDENLLTYGKFSQSYKEGADELKEAPDFEATEFNTTLAGEVNNNLTNLVKPVTPPNISTFMTDMVDICSNYLAQHAEFNKLKGPAFKLLIKSMKGRGNEELYQKQKAKRTYTTAATELEKAKGLDSDHDDPNLSQEIHAKLSKVVQSVTPADLKSDMAEIVDVCSKYLSQSAVDEIERGPAFDLLIRELELNGSDPFTPQFPTLETKYPAAYTLKSAPGLSGVQPDTSTSGTFVAALHKAVDLATPKNLEGDMKDVINRCGNYLSAYVRDRDKAMQILLRSMKGNGNKTLVQRNNYSMTYANGATEIETSPTIVPFLPIKDIADEVKEKLTKDVETTTPPELKIAMKSVVQDASRHLSQAVALRSGVAGTRYPLNYLAAMKRSLGKRQLFKFKAYAQSYANGAEAIKTSAMDKSPDMTPDEHNLKSEIVTELKRGVPLRTAPTIAKDMVGTMEEAGHHLAKIGVAKGNAMEHLINIMKEQGESPLAVMQGYQQTYSDGARRLENAANLENDKVEKGTYDNVLEKLTALNTAKPAAVDMTGIIDEASKYLAAPMPETEADKRRVLADLMARKGDAQLGQEGLYKMTYTEGGHEVMKAPTGVQTSHNEAKKKELANKMNDVIPDKKLQDILKDPVAEGAAHITDVLKGRGDAMQVLHDGLVKDKDKTLVDVGDFKKTYGQAAEMLETATKFGGHNPSPIIREDVAKKVNALNKEPNTPMGRAHMNDTANITSDFIAGVATKECGLDATALTAIDRSPLGGVTGTSGGVGGARGVGGAMGGVGAGGTGAGSSGAGGVRTGGAGANGGGVAAAGGPGVGGVGVGGASAVGSGAGTGGFGAGGVGGAGSGGTGVVGAGETGGAGGADGPGGTGGAGGFSTGGVGAGGGGGGGGKGTGGGGGARPGETEEERRKREAEERARGGADDRNLTEAERRKRRMQSGGGGGTDQDHDNALAILHKELRAHGGEVLYKQPQTALTHSQASDWLAMKPPMKVEKSVKDSGDTARLSKKFERKLSALVLKATPPDMYDAMQDVVIESSRILSEYFVSGTYKTLARHGLIAEMQKRGNEILIEVDGATETCIFAAQRLKKANTLDAQQSCEQVSYYLSKKLEEIVRCRTMPRKLNATMKGKHIKEASDYLSELVTKPDEQIEAYVTLIGEMETTGDTLLVEGNIEKSFKEAAAYLKSLTSTNDPIGLPNGTLQSAIEGKLKGIMANVTPTGYSKAAMDGAISECTRFIVSFIMLQGEKTEALKVLIEKMIEAGDSLLLRHGELRKSYKDGADKLDGKNADQLSVAGADPVVSRKIQIKLTNLMVECTPPKFQPVMEDVIEDATMYLAVHFFQPQIIKVCKCMKNVFVQCELWCDEILRRVTRPCCTCARHVSSQALMDLAPGQTVHVSPTTSRAYTGGIDISITQCPGGGHRDKPTNLPCPAAKPSSGCLNKPTTSYAMYSSSYDRYPFASSSMGLSSNLDMPSSSLKTAADADYVTKSECFSPWKSILMELYSDKTAAESSLEIRKVEESGESTTSYHTPMDENNVCEKETTHWQTPTIMLADQFVEAKIYPGPTLSPINTSLTPLISTRTEPSPLLLPKAEHSPSISTMTGPAPTPSTLTDPAPSLYSWTSAALSSLLKTGHNATSSARISHGSLSSAKTGYAASFSNRAGPASSLSTRTGPIATSATKTGFNVPLTPKTNTGAPVSTRASRPQRRASQSKSGYGQRPIVSTDQMSDWHAMMVSLMWNLQAWRDWIQENFDRALTHQPISDVSAAEENWALFQRRVATESLQWRQYNAFSRQLATRLALRYKDKQIVSPTRATIKTKIYLECQREMLDIIDMFNRWTHWLILVVKETDRLQHAPESDIPLHALRWNHFKKKIRQYSEDWKKYNKHLKDTWEQKYTNLIADWLPAFKQRGPVWVVSACGAVPSGAVAAGMFDGEVIWVARTTHRSQVLPAALHPSKHCCLVYADGAVHHYTKYQVMCNGEVRWVAWRAGEVGACAVRVAGGVHVGRVHYRGSHLVGAVHSPHYRCHVVIFGRPFAFNCYELLVLAS